MHLQFFGTMKTFFYSFFCLSLNLVKIQITILKSIDPMAYKKSIKSRFIHIQIKIECKM